MTNTSHEYYRGKCLNGPFEGEIHDSYTPVIRLLEDFPVSDDMYVGGCDIAPEETRPFFTYEWDHARQGWVLG